MDPVWSTKRHKSAGYVPDRGFEIYTLYGFCVEIFDPVSQDISR